MDLFRNGRIGFGRALQSLWKALDAKAPRKFGKNTRFWIMAKAGTSQGKRTRTARLKAELQTYIRRPHMLGPHTNTNQARGYSAQDGETVEEANHPGCRHRLRAAEDTAKNSILNLDLHPLSHTRRQFPSPLHLLQMARRYPTLR